ncbi:unnamed protein product [Kuraishia capsulata CBS 1993]|uniref:Major facilitator superfamily (MFS) profile domain-containing protein n=1 Tax=Kuraishia capsulata CBS 1993 TaxID=1382522 RepID=W6MXX2_9ASCO|nr:uncharacterized protein KUCA_T00005623001 [Kuraishia capsulata CBS 1993]CDK29630.1 unnamed protein product [Kuraishia capsulata CBS 1993]
MSSAMFAPFFSLRKAVKPYISHPIFVFGVVSASQWLDNINVSIVTSMVMQIQQKYDVPYPVATWTFSAFSLCYASFIMIFGRIGDIVGHHYMYIGGMFFLGIFNIIAASVQNIYVVIVFRALQGIAASATIPSSYALVSNLFTGRASHIAISVLTILMTTSFGLGSVLGGAFALTSIGYRGAFYLVGGISLLVAFLGALCVEPASVKGESLKDLDHIGVVIMLSGSLLLVTGLTEGGDTWKSPSAYVPIIFGVLLLFLFFAWELHIMRKLKRFDSVQLLIPMETWAIPNVVPNLLVNGIGYANIFSIMLLSVEVFEYVALNSPVIAGLKGLTSAVGLFVASILATLTFGKVPPKYVAIIATTVYLASSIVISRLGYSTESWWRYGLPGLAISGLCQCFITFFLFNSVIVSAPLEIEGVVSGMGMTCVQLFIAISSAGTSSIVGDVELGMTPEIQKRIMVKYRHAFYFVIAASALNVVLSLFIKDMGLGSLKEKREGKLMGSDTEDSSEMEVEVSKHVSHSSDSV